MRRILLVVVAAALVTAAGSTAARGPEKAPNDQKAVPGELIVGFQPGVSEAEREQALAKAGVKEKKKLVRGGRVKLAQGDPGHVERALKTLADDERVAYAEPNFVVHASVLPNDPSFGQLWGLKNDGQTVNGTRGVADADIDADLAWDVTTGSSSVVVGVIDTGVDFSHPDLAGVQWINPGEDCTGCRTNGVDDDGNGYADDWRGWDFVNGDNDPFDDHGHGTHVSGTIGAVGNNGVGIAGVAWNVRVMALKFLDWFGSGTTADAILALDYATAMGARITNNSWGGGEESQALLEAIERAGAAGGLVVAAAGNDGVNLDTSPSYPAAHDSPAILSVAATDASDALASFSNFGRVGVDLGAPGVSVYSTLPGGGYDWWDGTSMATPHVTGAAALAKAAFPSATGVGLKALLLRTVDAKSSLANTASGGRLNVGTAVSCSASPKLWLEAPAAGFESVVGDPLRIVAVGTSCAEPGATVTATANGVSIALTDRGDGLWTGTFTPTAAGTLTIQVAASVGAATDARSVSGSITENYRIIEEPFAWVDATAGGTNTGLAVDDGSVTVQLPFEFSLYGQPFTSAQISTNGYLVFGSSAATPWGNHALPSVTEPNGLVAPFWDDLRLATRGSVWHRTVGTAPSRRFVVSWVGAPHYYDVGDATFEVILEEATGDVVFQYRDVDFGDPFFDHGASATVGVESADGQRGRTFSVDSPKLAGYANAKAIRFSLGAPPPPPEPDTIPPAAPTGLTATGGEYSAALDWADNAEADLATYRVYRDGVAVATTRASSYTDTGLSAGVAYTYRVTAVDTSGNESASSGIATATPIADTAAPAAPTGLTATASNAQVVLDWADNGETDVAGYRVYRDGVHVATAAASAYTDTGLTNGVTYRYHVTAVDEVPNESAPSAEVAATPVAPREKAYQPASYAITEGSLYAGSLASLASDDGARLEVRSVKSWGWHFATFHAAATIAGAELSTLQRLTISFDGNATSSNAWLDFYVYDWTFGDWEYLDGDLWTTSDRPFTWTTSSPNPYVSSTGQIRFRVAADNDRAFRTRTDLIRFTITY